MWLTKNHYCEPITAADVRPGDLVAPAKVPHSADEYLLKVSEVIAEGSMVFLVTASRSRRPFPRDTPMWRALKDRNGTLVHAVDIGMAETSARTTVGGAGLYENTTYAPTRRLHRLTGGEDYPTSGEVSHLWEMFARGCDSLGVSATLPEFADWLTGRLRDVTGGPCEIFW